MLEIFSRDRGTDFEFFVFSDNEIKYKIKNKYEVCNQTKELYRNINTGTIILNEIPITIDNVTEEQVEYIKNIIDFFKERVQIYKDNYNPFIVKYTSGNDIFDLSANKKAMELANPKQFKEWVHITGFEHLEYFYNEYKKQNSVEFKVRKRIMKFLQK